MGADSSSEDEEPVSVSPENTSGGDSGVEEPVLSAQAIGDMTVRGGFWG